MGAKDPESRSRQRNVSGAASSQPWARSGAVKHTSSADSDGAIHAGGMGKIGEWGRTRPPHSLLHRLFSFYELLKRSTECSYQVSKEKRSRRNYVRPCSSQGTCSNCSSNTDWSCFGQAGKLNDPYLQVSLVVDNDLNMEDRRSARWW